jgi:hypothetical protein
MNLLVCVKLLYNVCSQSYHDVIKKVTLMLLLISKLCAEPPPPQPSGVGADKVG